VGVLASASTGDELASPTGPGVNVMLRRSRRLTTHVLGRIQLFLLRGMLV
jgi:hypothetical protein